MTKTLLQQVGRLLFWIGWPLIWLLSRPVQRRTRVVVRYKDDILLVKDWISSGQWTLPGGGVHFGEDARDCAVRELREETGIIASTKELSPHKEFTALLQSGLRFDCVVFLLKLSARPDLRLQMFEISDARWVPLVEIDNYDLNDAAKTIVQAFSES